MADFPAHPDQLTNKWLSEALGCQVSGFDSKALGEGVGVIGLVHRVTLQSEDGPATVIAKFAAESEDNRAVANTYNMYYREYLFYTSIAPEVPVRAPACYFAAYDEASSTFVILLEELQGYELGDQVTGCTAEEAEQVVTMLADLHRSTWQPDTRIGAHNSEAQIAGMTGGFGVGWPAVRERFPHLVSEELYERGLPLGDKVEPLLSRICSEPMCINHGDLRLDNVFFKPAEIAVVDFQATCLSAPEHDLAYFVTQSLKSDVRNARDWVALYHSQLTRDGISYSLEDCRQRYRACALYFLCYAAIIAGTLDLANERGRQMGETLLQNCLESIDELDALSLLDSL